MVKGSVDSIETFGLVDGPGIRTVVFLSGCKLRCKYCHNPEMWVRGNYNYTPDELAKKILRNKNYLLQGGGVTFSGGEPLLQSEFIIEVVKLLKKEKIHVALDTAGVGLGDYDRILKWIDLIIFDVKHINKRGYLSLTSHSIDESLIFVDAMNRSGKKVWIRQVMVPGVMDNDDYLRGLSSCIKGIKNVERIDFLPYHKLGSEKYITLGLINPYLNVPEMDSEVCNKLYLKFMKMYEEK